MAISPRARLITLIVTLASGERLIPFFKYSMSSGDISDTKQILALGLGVSGPPKRPNDYWGVGLAWGQPADSSLRDQWTGELFYRFQITPAQQVTLGVQGIVHPSFAPGDDVIGIFEAPWRVSF